MKDKIQAAVIVVLAAALGILTSQLMDARRRIAALERVTPSAAAALDDDEDDDRSDEQPPSATDGAGALRPMVQDLRARLQALEARAVASAPARGGQEPLDDDEDAALAALDGAPGPAAPAARGALGAAVADELDRREQARDEVRNERARARVLEKVAALAKDAALSPSQQQKLTDMLDAEQLEIRHLFRDARDSGDFATARDQVRAIRQKTDENAKAVLDDGQLDPYQAMRDEERSRFLGALRE